MAKEKPAEMVSVVVLKGKSLRHDGEGYPQNTRVSLPLKDANRLIKLGFVKSLESLLLEIDDSETQEASVTKEEGQTTITTSDVTAQSEGNSEA